MSIPGHLPEVLNLELRGHCFFAKKAVSPESVIRWKLINAFHTKLDAPSFNATSNDVAVESLELMADGVTITES